jgi:hypothetical protein
MPKSRTGCTPHGRQPRSTSIERRTKWPRLCALHMQTSGATSSSPPPGPTLKNSDFVVEQYRAGKLVRVFAPSGDEALPWQMRANGKSYLRTNGWVLSKILPTLMDGSPITTRVVAAKAPGTID